MTPVVPHISHLDARDTLGLFALFLLPPSLLWGVFFCLLGRCLRPNNTLQTPTKLSDRNRTKNQLGTAPETARGDVPSGLFVLFGTLIELAKKKKFFWSKKIPTPPSRPGRCAPCPPKGARARCVHGQKIQKGSPPYSYRSTERSVASSLRPAVSGLISQVGIILLLCGVILPLLSI